MSRISGQNVVATFADAEAASDAMLALGRGGIEADRMSMIGQDVEAAAVDPDTRLRDMEVTGEIATKAGVAGGAGAALGMVAGAAAFLIPGVGPVLGSGIWAGVLAGGAAGGVIGGMVGGVGALSLEEFDLKYQDTLREGKAIVAVAVDDDESVQQIRGLFEKEKAEDVHVIDGRGEKLEE